MLVINFPVAFNSLIFLFFLCVVDCGIPGTPSNGSMGTILHTREGATVEFWCMEGFIPSIARNSTCTHQGRWIPEPEELICASALAQGN